MGCHCWVLMEIFDAQKSGEMALVFQPFFEGFLGSVGAVLSSVTSLDGDLRRLEPSFRLVLARGGATFWRFLATKNGGKVGLCSPHFSGAFSRVLVSFMCL